MRIYIYIWIIEDIRAKGQERLLAMDSVPRLESRRNGSPALPGGALHSVSHLYILKGSPGSIVLNPVLIP